MERGLAKHGIAFTSKPRGMVADLNGPARVTLSRNESCENVLPGTDVATVEPQSGRNALFLGKERRVSLSRDVNFDYALLGFLSLPAPEPNVEANHIRPSP